MSNQQEVHKFLIKTFNAFGLGFENGKKLTTTIIVLSAVPFLTIFLMFTTEYARTIEEKVRVCQITPLFLLIAVKAINVKIKFGSIVNLIESTDKMLKEYDGNMIIKQSHNSAMKLMKFMLFINILSTVMGQISVVLTHELPIPMWIPIKSYENTFFWLNWAIYTFCGTYVILSSFAMDTLVLYLMMSFKSCSQMLLESNLKAPSERKQKEIIVMFMRQTYDMKV